MHDPAEMRVIEGARNLERDDGGDIPGELRRMFKEIVKIDPLHILHHDMHRAPVFDKIEDVEDIFVLERRHKMRLSLKTFGELRVERDAGFQRFNGDISAERLLDSLIDGRHPAAPDLTDDPTIADLFDHSASYPSRSTAPTARDF